MTEDTVVPTRSEVYLKRVRCRIFFVPTSYFAASFLTIAEYAYSQAPNKNKNH